MLAPSYIAATVSILSVVFPDVPAGDLNVTINTLVAIVAGIVVLVRQLTNGRSTLVGTKPK